MEVVTCFKDMWRGESNEESLRKWCGNRDLNEFKDLLLIIAWGVYLHGLAQLV